jgi:hypothetical protein
MPYKGEPPGRLSQGEIASNPDFQNFLKVCTPLRGPSDTSVNSLLELFQPYALAEELPGNLLAIDGGEYVSSVSKNFPSREILHVRIGSIFLDLSALLKIGERSIRTVNPFEIQRTLQDKTALTLFFTGSNVLRQGGGLLDTAFAFALTNKCVRKIPDLVAGCSSTVSTTA